MLRKSLQPIIAATVLIAFATDALAVEWNVSLWGKRRALTEHVEKIAELVAQKTGGEFTLNLSYGGLSNSRGNLDGISIGAFEMAHICASYHRDKNPSITVLELPFIGNATVAQDMALSLAVYRHPAVAKDLARWNATILMPSPMPPFNLMGVGEAPRTLADYNGLPVRALGGSGKAMEALGAVPTSLTAPEVRQALDSGVIKAAGFAQHAHLSFGIAEVGKWWTTNLNLGSINCPIIVNRDALADLSDAHRDALLGSVDAALEHYIDYYTNTTLTRFGSILEERGIEKITYSKDEMEQFREKVAQSAAEAWIMENTARGLPAQELHDIVSRLSAM